MTVLKIGKGFGPCIFSIIEPSLLIIINDGVSVNPNEFAKAISLSMNDSYFLVSKHELNSVILIFGNCETNFFKFSVLTQPESIGP